MKRITLTTKPAASYELIDSGREEKLERYGNVILARPDPQALWEKRMPKEEWAKANGRYIRDGREGKWIEKGLPKEWQIEFGGLQFLIRPTSFKHTGLFPEQLSNWEWVTNLLHESNSSGVRESSAEDSLSSRAVALESPLQSSFVPSVLNLFGYTGGVTLAAAKADAQVTHVDASKMVVAWARENAEVSGLADKPIRWIVEDVLLFVEREIKRGKRYDGIIMDPPAFGHGPKNELWKIEEDFLKLMDLSGQLLSEKPLFFLINGYAAGYSPLAFVYNLEFLTKKFGLPANGRGHGGTLECGDLTIEESGSQRLLPCGIFARWRA